MTMARAWRARVEGLAASMTPSRRRALRDGLIAAGVIFNLTLLLFWGPRLYWWIDAEAWARINLADLYGTGMGDPQLIGAFRYAPVIAWLFLPATWVSWPILIAAYLALSGFALVAMTGRWAPVFLLAFPPVLLEVLNGNIHLFMALAVWAGLRWPAAWAFILLTKITPGVGLLWFAGRRDWRGLAIALGVTLTLVAVGIALAPGMWIDWVRSLFSFAAAQPPTAVPPLWLRLPIAAALAFWAGQTNRAWLVPVAVFLALPVLWLQGLAIVTASFPLWWERDRWRAAKAPAASTTALEGAAA
jgi:Glycosyltransferase family 87